MVQENLHMLSLNVQSGGFDSYDPGLTTPSRQADILTVVDKHHLAGGGQAVSLTDTYRWDDIYHGDAGIASHLGFKQARFVRLEDERLSRDNGAGIGVTFATDKRIEQSTVLDLDTRQGLGVILDIGRYGLQIATIYADDLSEATRLAQFKALFSGLEPGVPTILNGDFNGLRPNMNGASFGIKAKDMAVRALAHTLSRSKPLGVTVREMNRRQLIPYIESQGYRDADGIRKRPTAPAKLPLFGVDYVFHSPEVSVTNFRVLPDKVSDHLPIAYTVSV